jgi:uncharacterized protein (TIGR03435 family)
MSLTLEVLLALGLLSLVQSPSRMEFEVASVKPAAPQGPVGTFVGVRGGPGTADPERITYTNFPLRRLITEAYQVTSYQVIGPGFLDDFQARFDVAAKVPAGATKEQTRVMLQNLLADRFKLSLHHETKELPLYELTVAKNGPKIKPSVEDPNALKPAQGGSPPPAPKIGKDGFPELPPGRKATWMSMGPGGSRIVAMVQSLADFTSILVNQLGSLVVDKTGLTGTYDFVLEFSMEAGQVSLARSFAGGVGDPKPPQDSQPELPNMYTAVQEQLGLKLEKKKGPVDTLVIDHVERMPTEN